MLGRRFNLILICLILALVAGGVSLRLAQPTYQATTLLWVVRVGSAGLDYDSQLFNRNLAKTYVELIRSGVVAEKVMARLHPPGSLQGKISAGTVRETEIISVTVTDGNPERAAAIADQVAEVSAEQARLLSGLDNLQVLARATVPSWPVYPRPLLTMLMATLLGLVAGVCLVLLAEGWSDA